MAELLRILLLLLYVLPVVHSHSRQFQLLRNVLSSSIDTLRDDQKKLRGEILNDVQTRIVPQIRQAVKEEVMRDVRREIQTLSRSVNTPQADIGSDLQKEIQRDIMEKIYGPMKKSIKEETQTALVQDIQSEVRKGLASYLRQSLKREITETLRRDIRQEVQSSLIGHIKDSVKDDVMKQIENGGPLKVQTKLTPYQRRILKASIMKEVKEDVKKEVDKAAKDNDAVMGLVRKQVDRSQKQSVRILKEGITKEIKDQIDNVYTSKNFERTFKESIMKDVRREIDEIHTEMFKIRSSPDESDRDNTLNPTVDLVTDHDRNTLQLVRDLESQEKNIQTLSKRVRHLEKKLHSVLKQVNGNKSTNSDTNVVPPRETTNRIPEKSGTQRRRDKSEFVPSIKELPDKIPQKGETQRRKNKSEINSESVPTISTSSNSRRKQDYDKEIAILAKTEAKYDLPERDSILIAKQNQSDTHFLDLTSASYSPLSTSLGLYVGDVAYDVVDRTIYWSDWRIDALFAYNMKDRVQVMLKPKTLSYGIEVDTKRRVIVCSDYWSRSIFTMDIVMNGDSSRAIHQITRVQGGNPMRLALDAAGKRIYVSVSYTKIVQIHYENGRTRTIVEIKRSFINGLAVNPRTKTLYFNNFTSIMAKNIAKRRKGAYRVVHIAGREPSDLLVYNGDVYIAYYNSADIDIIRGNRTQQVTFAEMPYSSDKHLRTSICFVPAR